VKVEKDVRVPDKGGNKNYELLFSAFRQHNQELVLSAGIAETRS